MIRTHARTAGVNPGDSHIDVAVFARRCRSLVHDLEISERSDAFAYVLRLIESIPDVPQGPVRATIQNMALATLGRMLAHACHRASGDPTTHERVIQRACETLSIVRSVTAAVPPRHPKVTATVHFIQTRYSNSALRLSDVARHVALSASHLDRLLKQNTGLTFVQHLRQVRTRQAVQLLQNGLLSIKEIGVACGYNSTSSFDRDFRRLHRCTPTELRRRACAPTSTELLFEWDPIETRAPATALPSESKLSELA